MCSLENLDGVTTHPRKKIIWPQLATRLKGLPLTSIFLLAYFFFIFFAHGTKIVFLPFLSSFLNLHNKYVVFLFSFLFLTKNNL